MLDRIAGNGVANDHCRDGQPLRPRSHRAGDGAQELRELGIELIAADSPDSFVDDTPTAVMVRQILGAVAQFEKAALVAKLKGARVRVRREKGKCEGRKSLAETKPEAVALAKRLHRASPKTGDRMSWRRISAELAAAGHLNELGRPYNSKSIGAMLGLIERRPQLGKKSVSENVSEPRH